MLKLSYLDKMIDISKFINNAQIIYSDNYLEGGEIQADLNKNILESKINFIFEIYIL